MGPNLVTWLWIKWHLFWRFRSYFWIGRLVQIFPFDYNGWQLPYASDYVTIGYSSCKLVYHEINEMNTGLKVLVYLTPLWVFVMESWWNEKWRSILRAFIPEQDQGSYAEFLLKIVLEFLLGKIAARLIFKIMLKSLHIGAEVKMCWTPRDSVKFNIMVNWKVSPCLFIIKASNI